MMAPDAMRTASLASGHWTRGLPPEAAGLFFCRHNSRRRLRRPGRGNGQNQLYGVLWSVFGHSAVAVLCIRGCTMSMIVKATLGLASAYALVVLAAWLGQRRLMYVPDTERTSPHALGLDGVAEVELPTPDGARVVVWRAPAEPGRPTIVYLHGNAGNLATRADRARRYRVHGYGLAMLSWRGYGGSSGSPTESANVADARLLYEYLREEGVAASDIVVYGESLGSGVAVQLAAAVPVGAVVLDAPYTSIVEVAVRAYPYLPVRPLLLDRYESESWIDRIGAPLLVLHGELDTVIPVGMGTALFGLAREPKRLVLYPEGSHSNLDEHGAVEDVVRWLSAMRADGFRRPG